MAEEKLGDVAGRVSAMAGEVGSKANAQWDKLESIFEERTARALGRLGLPAARDLADLVDRVAALETELAALKAGQAPAAVPKFKPGKALRDPAAAKPAKPAARTARKKAAVPAQAAAPATAPRRRAKAA